MLPDSGLLLKDGLLEKYAEWKDFDVLENANRYPGPTGFVSYVAERSLWNVVEEVLPPKVLLEHGRAIYVHKLPYSIYIPYCTGHSIRRLLLKGLRTPAVVSRPARHFDTFVDHIANFLITMQHYFTGAQALSSVEWFAGPFIRRDGLSFEQVKQNVQRLVFNLNYPSRVGLQAPFTNFTVVLDAPRKTLEIDRAIIDGKPVDRLASYEKEAKMFLLALAEVLREGDAVGQPFTFPIPTIMTTARMLWDDPEVFEAVFRTAATKGSFYWLNTRVVDPDATFAMCCRLSIQLTELEYVNGGGLARKDVEELREQFVRAVERRRFGGLWAIAETTGSINVTDVNLPRLALIARGDDTKFWELYEEALRLVKFAEDWLRARYTKLVRLYPHVYSMILEYMPEFPGTHFNTIGLIGLPEAAAILMQNPRLWFEGSRSDWLRAADLMRKMVEFAVEHARKWMIEEGVPWNVEEVPGESAAAKLAQNDLREFPELAEYLPDPRNPIYSTSIAPYYGALELPDRIEIEAMVQKHFTGGVMMHIFIAQEPDPEALATLTRKLMNTDLVYWSYTPALTVCKRCSRSFVGIHMRCPRCGSEEVEVWSRIVGYYRPVKNWNPYRQAEFWRRKHYAVS